MTTDIRTQVLHRIQDLAQSGQNEKAFACMQEYILENPADGKAMNDAGAILYSMGRFEEAVGYLQKAKKISGDCPQILWNLVETYLELGKTSEASQLFDLMAGQGILNPDILNRTATSFLNQNEKGQALEMLLHSIRLSPDQQVLKPMIEVIRSKRPKIAFFCGGHDAKFLSEIHRFAQERFSVELFTGTTIAQMYDLMKWSDISWFEWCSEFALEASKFPKVCQNIVRLHRWEAYEEIVQNVCWNKIDVLITVGNSFVMKELHRRVPNIDSMTRVITIPNGINLEKCNFVERQRGKNIACVNYLNIRKNPMFLLQCMQKLHYIDSEYRLFFAGNFQDSALEQYIMHMIEQLGLKDVVIFDGWQEDVSKWLEDKHYIVSASISESQGLGLLEGMACGLKPVIHCFPGAEEIFPSEFLFTISEEFCRQILSDSYDSQRYREFVVARYPLKKQLDSINQIFNHFENQPFQKNESVSIDNATYACIR